MRMCDRYSLGVDVESVTEDPDEVHVEWSPEPKGDVQPGAVGPILVRRGTGVSVILGSWGIHQPAAAGRSQFGTLLTSLLFADVSVELPEWTHDLSPCAVPADGFVGNCRDGEGEMPWRFARVDGRLLWMAALGSLSPKPNESSFVLLTAPLWIPGTGLVQRAPILLSGSVTPTWLDPATSSRSDLRRWSRQPVTFLKGSPLLESAGTRDVGQGPQCVLMTSSVSSNDCWAGGVGRP